MELINILKIKIRYLLKYDKILYIKIDLIYSIVHVTTEKNYDKIVKNGYLCPYKEENGTGVFCFIQKKKDEWKEMKSLRLWGNLVIELDKNILIERNDYTIHNARDALGIKYFGGPIVYSAKDDNDIKKLSSSLHKLTKLNEIRFENKISLKKYMISK